jgi:cytochrome c oxidase assembly protein subunit 11
MLNKTLNILNKQNFKLRFKLCVMGLSMFAFGFALIPFYKKICELTGVNILSLTEEKNKAGASIFGVNKLSKNTQIDTTRLLSIEFDANVHGGFKFTPKVNHLDIHPGALHTVIYTVTNTSAQTITAQAVPSYAPLQASIYFNKLECFCFKQQTFKPYESREMPVTFVIDAKIPKHINTLTLSYTFFSVAGLNNINTKNY